MIVNTETQQGLGKEGLLDAEEKYENTKEKQGLDSIQGKSTIKLFINPYNTCGEVVNPTQMMVSPYIEDPISKENMATKLTLTNGAGNVMWSKGNITTHSQDQNLNKDTCDKCGLGGNFLYYCTNNHKSCTRCEVMTFSFTEMTPWCRVCNKLTAQNDNFTEVGDFSKAAFQDMEASDELLEEDNLK